MRKAVTSLKSEITSIPGAMREVIDWSTDGCSGAPDLNFTECCEEHDLFYRNGLVPRRVADKALRQCIRGEGWYVLPWVYWAAVRMFGWRAFNWDMRRQITADVGTKHQAWAAEIDLDTFSRVISGNSATLEIVRWVIKRVLSWMKLK